MLIGTGWVVSDEAVVHRIQGRVRYLWRETVVRDGSLSLAELRVLMLLECYADGNGGSIRPGRARVAAELGVSEKTVTRGFAAGVARGYLRVVKRAPKGRGNTEADTYALSLPPEKVDAEPVDSVDNPVEDVEKGDIAMSPITAVDSVDNPVDNSEKGDIAMSPITRNRGHFEAEKGDIAMSHYQTNNQLLGVRKVTNYLREPIASGSPDESPKGDGPAADASRPSGLGPEPAATCLVHAGVVNPPNCGKCRDARRANEAWRAEYRVFLADSAAERRNRVAECSRCDETGWIDLGDSVARCDHRPALRVVGE